MKDRSTVDLLALRSFIDDTEHNREDERRYYLQHVRYLLFREPVIDFVYLEEEYRGHSGDSDYIVSGLVDGGGVRDVRVYMWELKAPQCPIFQKDTRNRLCGSEVLTQAENQLLHYYDNLKFNPSLYTEFCVKHPENVRLGGIVIGCNRTKVAGDYDEEKRTKLYAKAIRCKSYLYRAAGIRLMHWDQIYRYLSGDYISSIYREEREYIFETPKLSSGTNLDMFSSIVL